MKKLLAMILSTLMGLAILTGCSKQENSIQPAVDSMAATIVQTVEIPQVTTIDDADTILTMYDLDASKIAEMVLLKSGNGANADEVIIIKSNDAADLGAIEEALKLRITVLTDLFADYNAEDMPKIKNAEIVKEGNYIMLAVCADPNSAVDMFKASFKE